MKRKSGNPEEAYLLDKLKEIYGTSAFKPTNSAEGDVITPGFVWEHKFRNTIGFTIQAVVWLKAKVRALRRSREPVLVIKNKEGNRLAVIELDTLLSLIRKAHGEE